MAGTPVPEAAVDENGKSAPAKAKVWLAWEEEVAAPPGNVVGPEQFGEREFGLLVATTANGRHHR